VDDDSARTLRQLERERERERERRPGRGRSGREGADSWQHLLMLDTLLLLTETFLELRAKPESKIDFAQHFFN
jgi:hypothetical protein